MLLWIIFLVSFVNESHEWNPTMENDGKLFEGDIILRPLQRKILKEKSLDYSSIKDVSKLWPSKTIPYSMSLAFGSNKGAVAVLKDAMAQLERYTCLKFRLKQSYDRSYMHFHTNAGCSSEVGYKPGENRVSLSLGCHFTGTALHEILHSLGFWHEQSRPDRDRYITINWNNIEKRFHSQFEKQTFTTVDSLGTPYDYRSVMHYSAVAFGGGKQSIATKDPAFQDVIGKRTELSDIDKKQVNLLYKCGPITTMKPTSAPTYPPGCVDKVSNCEKIKDACYAWEQYMKANCKRTCNYC